jgi:hypothetical protein
MTWRFSTGLRDALLQSKGFSGAFNQGYIELYSGTQPVSADAAKGTALIQITSSSGALTKETRASGSVTLTTGASGSINTVTVGGFNIIPGNVVAFNTSLAQTASDLCDAINRCGIMEATVSGLVVTIVGRPGTGVTTAAVSATVTTLGIPTYVTMGSVAAGIAPVNGLYLGAAASGVISKPTAQVWSGVGLVAGTAGWGRFYSSDGTDTGLLLTGAPWYPRLDGSCGVGTGDFRLSTTSIAVGLPVTVDAFAVTAPAS